MKRVVWLRFPGIVAVAYLVFLTGCRSPLKSGVLRCGTDPHQPCPSGYYCETTSNRCWANGTGPDSGTGGPDSGTGSQTPDSGTDNEKPDTGGIEGNAGDASSDRVAPPDGAAVVDTAVDALTAVDVVAVLDTAVDVVADKPVVVDVANDPSVGQPDLACTPTSIRCDDHQPQVCDPNGQWQNVGSACRYVCSANTATCIGVCTPGTRQCNGLQPQTCDDNGAWQDTGLPCAHVCSGSGATCTGACTPTTTECNGTQPRTCDATGTWQNTGNPCTGCYTCSSTTGACAPATGNSCDDGNACTQTDTCQSGVCVGSNPVTCTALDQCHNAGTCDTGTGLCSNPAKLNNTTCTDGNPCTQTDTCQSGICVGSNPVTCTALDQCHNPGTCDTGTGVCSNPAKPNSTTCTDGNACTTGETCQAGVCTGGTAVTCPAPTVCHVAGTCSGGTCSTPIAPDGTRDTNCIQSMPVCYSGNCVPCTSVNGSSGAEWCQSNVPSCNLSTHKCVCRIPSAGNLVQNPGFDTNLTGWITSSSYWTSDDADVCHPDPGSGLPGSGSVAGANTDGDPKQCVPLPNGSGTYYFGAKFKFSDFYNGSFCTVSFYSDTSCATFAGATYDHMGPDGSYVTAGGWIDFFLTQQAPTGSKSALILCALDSMTTEIDQVYLNRDGTSF